jgi:hypothetical protein
VRYTVVWTTAGEQDLAALWLTAPDRAAVSSAANTIDALLANDPDQRGESRYDTVRILFVPPLGVDFDVQEPDRIVYVLSAWLLNRP